MRFDTTADARAARSRNITRAVGGLLLALPMLGAATAAMAQAPSPSPRPSFDCAKARPDSVDLKVCADPLIAALDAEMARLYRLATDSRGIRKSQPGWLRQRDACHANADEANCLRDSYLARIDELRARSRAARANRNGISLGPFTYRCQGIDGQISVTFVNTDPAFARVRNKERVQVLQQEISGSGARYGDAAGAMFWSKGRGGLYQAGPGLPEASCKEEPRR
ncbi:MliC family protein [Variovorax sp. J22P168]|uniref:MliC family protein n=1 Tax=Variovorax jilinensis TaxID=3053513 RepID=UPI002578380D|nr:MliC family protein [Variovorax sp. J22P168]MDM0012741.1 MliC family protein [Variovorax sp. J22P168]